MRWFRIVTATAKQKNAVFFLDKGVKLVKHQHFDTPDKRFSELAAAQNFVSDFISDSN